MREFIKNERLHSISLILAAAAAILFSQYNTPVWGQKAETRSVGVTVWTGLCRSPGVITLCRPSYFSYLCAKMSSAEQPQAPPPPLMWVDTRISHVRLIAIIARAKTQPAARSAEPLTLWRNPLRQVCRRRNWGQCPAPEQHLRRLSVFGPGSV